MAQKRKGASAAVAATQPEPVPSVRSSLKPNASKWEKALLKDAAWDKVRQGMYRCPLIENCVIGDTVSSTCIHVARETNISFGLC